MARHDAIPAGWDPTEKTIHRTFRTGSFSAGVRFISAIAKEAEKANHHPDIILTYATVIVTLTTHDEGMVTLKDIAMANDINRIWEERSVAGDHGQA